MVDYYNWECFYSVYNGKILMECYFEFVEKILYFDVVYVNYQFNEEYIQEQNYKFEFELRKLK